MTAAQMATGCMACTGCQRNWLGVEAMCPACGEALELVDIRAHGEPEHYVEDQLGTEGVQRALERAFTGVRYRVSGLNPSTLAANAVRTWWPLWLVDADICGTWRARVGTDYEVQSSREVLRNETWVREPHIDTRIRWEPRHGRVEMHADNAEVQAMHDKALWESRLGTFNHEGRDGTLPAGPILLPDRSPQESIDDALEALRRKASAHCHQAMGTDHIDDFGLTGPMESMHWTWQLLPVYITHYQDDTGVRRVLWIHGVTGQVFGPRMASTTKGWLWAALWVTLGLICLAGSAFVALLGIILWPLLLLAAVGALVGFFGLGLAIVPILAPRKHNHRELAATA